jgi:hypothetical protein
MLRRQPEILRLFETSGYVRELYSQYAMPIIASIKTISNLAPRLFEAM